MCLLVQEVSNLSGERGGKGMVLCKQWECGLVHAGPFTQAAGLHTNQSHKWTFPREHLLLVRMELVFHRKFSNTA